MHNYKDLFIWQKSMDLVAEIYKLVRLLPKEETYALSDQMRRAAVSIPSNISEGSTRESKKDFIRFLNMAQGSCAELSTQLLLCDKLGFIGMEEITPILALLDEITKMIRAFSEKLKNAVDET